MHPYSCERSAPPITTLLPSLPSLPLPLPSNQPLLLHPPSLHTLPHPPTPILTMQLSHCPAISQHSAGRAHRGLLCVLGDGRRQYTVRAPEKKGCVELKWTQYSCCTLIQICSCSGIQWHCCNMVLKRAVADECWMIAPQLTAVLLFWDYTFSALVGCYKWWQSCQSSFFWRGIIHYYF